MSTYDDERDMWNAIGAQAREAEQPAEGLVTTQTARTRRGERVVLLTDRMVAASEDSGLVATTDGDTVVWYRLGKPFTRGGATMRYGYLAYDAAIATERRLRREARDWHAAH